MPGSALADLQNTYGVAFIGLIISTVYYVVSFSPYLPELMNFQPLWCDDNSDVSGGTYRPQAVNLRLLSPSDGFTTGNRLSFPNVIT